MMEQVIRFSHTSEGFRGEFLLTNGTPVPIAKEMLFQFSKYIAQIEDQARAQQEPAQTSEPCESVAQVEESAA